MTSTNSRRTCAAGTLLALSVLVGPIASAQEQGPTSIDLPPSFQVAPDRTRLSPDQGSTALAELARIHDELGPQAAIAEARARRLRLDERDRLLVTLRPRTDGTAAFADLHFASIGVEVAARARRSLRLAVPVERLRQLAGSLPRPARLVPSEGPVPDEDEAVMVTGAFTYHARGSTGSGVRVAVIDGGFDDLSTVVASGDLAYVYSKSYSGSLESSTDHGTNAALVVHQMAPDADLYLYKVSDSTDLENAVDDCISRGIDVISHSMSWYGTSFNDGTGDVCDIAGDAISAGIVWCNSAGNRAESHWYGSWSNSDGDDWCNVSGSSEVIPVPLDSGDDFTARLTWDDFADSDQDYDLYLYRYSGGSLTRVASSIDAQPGADPYESISYTASSTATYYLAIHRYDASGSMRFQLFTSHDLSSSYQVASYSVTDPGSRGAVLAIGAADWNPYDSTSSVKGYSSRGPTTDGTTKPDLVAPTDVATALGTFTGTSCACPNAAGAIAVYLSDPSKSGSARSNLLADAVDMGSAGMDSTWGRGRMELDPYDDAYEDNDSKTAAASISIGTHADLVCQDGDFYSTTLSSSGSISVSIAFDHTYGDLDLRLYRLESDGSLTHIASSTSDTDDESVSASGLAAGTYVFRVWLDAGDCNGYSLTLRKTFTLERGTWAPGTFGG